jgi:hypothetical protein
MGLKELASHLYAARDIPHALPLGDVDEIERGCRHTRQLLRLPGAMILVLGPRDRCLPCPARSATALGQQFV